MIGSRARHRSLWRGRHPGSSLVFCESNHSRRKGSQTNSRSSHRRPLTEQGPRLSVHSRIPSTKQCLAPNRHSTLAEKCLEEEVQPLDNAQKAGPGPKPLMELGWGGQKRERLAPGSGRPLLWRGDRLRTRTDVSSVIELCALDWSFFFCG